MMVGFGPRKSKIGQYITYGSFLPQKVFEFLDNPEHESHRSIQIGNDSYRVKLNSVRYKVFRRSLTCVKCGIRGTKFLLQKDKCELVGSAHFNLYAVENGKDVLMTKHHIVPSSKGGSDELDNLQTMCVTCNKKEDNK